MVVNEKSVQEKKNIILLYSQIFQLDMGLNLVHRKESLNLRGIPNIFRNACTTDLNYKPILSIIAFNLMKYFFDCVCVTETCSI